MPICDIISLCDTYFCFNIVYNNPTIDQPYFLTKGAADRKEGNLRVSVLYSFISFFYFYYYFFIISIIISVCSFRTPRVQFFHIPSEIFAQFK